MTEFQPKAVPTLAIADSLTKQDKAVESSVRDNWFFLADSVSGCLVGGEYCYNGKCGGEGCCFDIDERWENFFKQNEIEIAEFLLTQLSDTTKTKVHVCPFFVATKGELAIYCLQRIYKINWFDLDTKYSKYTDGTLMGGVDYYSRQAELQKELSSNDGIVLLTGKWKERIK